MRIYWKFDIDNRETTGELSAEHAAKTPVQYSRARIHATTRLHLSATNAIIELSLVNQFYTPISFMLNESANVKENTIQRKKLMISP